MSEILIVKQKNIFQKKDETPSAIGIFLPVKKFTIKVLWKASRWYLAKCDPKLMPKLNMRRNLAQKSSRILPNNLGLKRIMALVRITSEMLSRSLINE